MPGMKAPDGARQVLSACYGMDVAAIDRVSPAVHRCTTPDGDVCYLKRFDPLFTDKLAALGQLYLAMADRGLTPPLRPDRHGHAVASHGGDRFMLQRAAGPAVPPCPHRAASALARLHAALRTACGGLVLRGHLEHDHASLADFAALLGMPDGRDLVHQSRDMSDELQIVHGDPHPGNVAFGTDTVQFLDFDTAHVASARAEAALAAYRLGGHAGGHLDGMPSFLADYTAESHARSKDCTRPISMGEALAHVYTHVLARVHFILAAQARSETRFLYDLPAQMDRLSKIYSARKGQ